MLLLYPYGVHTMIIVYVSINICWLLVWHYFVWQQIRLNLFAALKDILPFAFIATAVMAATYYVTIGFANLYLLMASKIIIVGTLYTATVVERLCRFKREFTLYNQEIMAATRHSGLEC